MPSLDRFARLWSLEPALKHHHWADPEFISRLLGMPEPRPVAEAWFGAHPDGPALARCRGGRVSALDALIDAQPEAWLGSELSDRFGTLPYLFKVLAAGRPLSIQVHPGPAEAVVGFGQEEAEGVARGDPGRVYKDARHKPELFLALTQAHALCGFRPYEDMEARLQGLPELRHLFPRFSHDSQGLKSALEAWFAHPSEVVSTALTQLLRRLEREASEAERTVDDPARWALFAERTLGFEAPDRGLLFVFLLEIVHMSPGEGIYLDAGVPHAYLMGSGVEVMANSDNV
ncbi:MAG: mannose-6-phosphate isomerase, class I, partial [Myxococcota bacterium]